MASVLGTDRAGAVRPGRRPSTAEAKRFGRALCRRCTGTPLQHLTGESGVPPDHVRSSGPGVFVPRPETEVARRRGARGVIAGSRRPSWSMSCTGAGAIALAIADEHPDARVLATDLSPEAVALARRERRPLGARRRGRPGRSARARPAILRGSVDLVTCNPPYVADGAPRRPPARRCWRTPSWPCSAGTEVYERFFAQAAGVAAAGRARSWWRSRSRRDPAVRAARAAAGFVDVEVEHDLNGRDRWSPGRTAVTQRATRSTTPWPPPRWAR